MANVKVPSLNATVFGTAWTAYQQEKPFLNNFPRADDSKFQLMLLHAEVDSMKTTEGFIPIRQDQIASSGLDYLALGHGEVWSGIQRSGETYWADCGTVEARGFLNSDPHGVIIGEIGKESSHFEFRELGQRSYIEKNLTIEPQDTPKRLVEKLLAEISPEERQKDLFRIKLAGMLSNIEEMAQSLQRLLETRIRFIEVLALEERIQAELRPHRVSAKKSPGYPTQAQIFVDQLQECLIKANGSESREYWELVRKIGLTALGQGRVFDED